MEENTLVSVKRLAKRFLRGGHWKHPLRAWRLWRAERIGQEATYRECWDYLAATKETAYLMIDGSETEEGFRATGQQVAEALKEGLLITKGHRVLEIGCGAARIGKELASHCGFWHGVDVSPKMIDLARPRTEHLSNVSLAAVEGPSLQIFPDNYFDRIYSWAVFFHLDKEDVFMYIQEIYRTLKPSGLAYYDTWNLLDELGWKRWLLELERYRDFGKKPRHRNQWSTPQEMRRYSEKAGLAVLHVLEGFLIQVLSTKLPPDISVADSSRLLAELREQVMRVADHLLPPLGIVGPVAEGDK
jgi:ubiquinone/menaquinone biosynthesis C-methylase UbiE